MLRSGQAADRADITRQAGSRRQAANDQSSVGSPGKHRETEYRGNRIQGKQNTGETQGNRIQGKR